MTDSAVVLTNAQLALVGPAPDPSSRQSVAPRLSVVRTPTSRDLAIDVVLTNTMLADRALVDTLPHPVLVLLPPRDRDEAVYATVDAERDAAVTAELARGADVRAYRPRHTA